MGYLLPPRGDIMITLVCLFVGWLVRSFVRRLDTFVVTDFSKTR